MGDKQMAIAEVGKAVESLNAGDDLAAIEHAEKAMKLDPSVTSAYDMMGVACLQLANYFSGTPDSKEYEKRSLAAFKQAARMGSKSAIGQLAHLGVKWEYPRCTACGGYADPETDIEVLVKCMCGVDVSINRSSVNKTSGVTVVHDNLADYSTEHGAKWQRCRYSTYVPPAVWCSECRVNFVVEWERLLVSGTSADVEVAQWKQHPIATQYRQMARDLVDKHGPLTRVEHLSHFPDFEINFVFERKTVYSGRRRGPHDIHFLSLGYIGEGPRYAREFLDEAGFTMSAEDIDAIKPGAVIQLRSGTVVVEYPPKTPDTGSPVSFGDGKKKPVAAPDARSKSAVHPSGVAAAASGGPELLEATQKYYKAVEHNDRAAHLAQEGRLKEAVDEFLNAIEMSPRFETAYCNLAAVFVDGGQPAAAIEVLEKLLGNPEPEAWEQALGNHPQREKAKRCVALAKETLSK